MNGAVLLLFLLAAASAVIFCKEWRRLRRQVEADAKVNWLRRWITLSVLGTLVALGSLMGYLLAVGVELTAIDVRDLGLICAATGVVGSLGVLFQIRTSAALLARMKRSGKIR